jgi:hypothetical protein
MQQQQQQQLDQCNNLQLGRQFLRLQQQQSVRRRPSQL